MTVYARYFCFLVHSYSSDGKGMTGDGKVCVHEVFSSLCRAPLQKAELHFTNMYNLLHNVTNKLVVQQINGQRGHRI